MKPQRVANTTGVFCDGALEVTADEVRVNWRHLRDPDRIYEADFAWIRRRLGAVSFFFGKEDLNNEGTLRTRLEVRYPDEKFISHFWRNSREFHQKIREAKPAGLHDARRDALDPFAFPALKDHSERANFEQMARFGTDACIDFYYFVPGGIARHAQGLGPDRLRIDPVARIQLTTHELLRLLESAEPLAAEIARELPEELENAE